MQNIKAKKESMIRLAGMVIILLGLLLSIVLDFFINNPAFYIMLLMIIIPWFVVIILMKLEIDIIVDKSLIWFIVLIVYTLIMSFIGILLYQQGTYALIFISTAISNILLILSWHYALSIFKKKKIVFISGAAGYCVLTFLFRLIPLITHIFWLIAIAPLGLVVLGVILIMFAELRMKKKGLLNWI
ncbi:MAG: hypothetical protein GF383_14005 [Candidatus Lokiarchaeota archaeon]|nr:hypothetical protein [Candidatus Lokiarchaeota archaeon]MBD3342441.1 hypothetical protein [Candidatus Lokiarchaeota archaeon]